MIIDSFVDPDKPLGVIETYAMPNDSYNSVNQNKIYLFVCHKWPKCSLSHRELILGV